MRFMSQIGRVGVEDVFIFLLMFATVSCFNSTAMESDELPDRDISKSLTDDEASRFLEKFVETWKHQMIHGKPRAVPGIPGYSEKYQKIQLQNKSTDCHLHTVRTGQNVSAYETILDFKQNGYILMKYIIDFPEYKINPLTTKASRNYKPNIWFYAYDYHAYSLLSMPFNYKDLSLYTLSINTAEMKVKLIDYPKQCFSKLSTSDKMYITMDLVANEFNDEHGQTKTHDEKEHVCHQIIRSKDGLGHFTYRCCRRDVDSQELQCVVKQLSSWIYIYNIILTIVKIAALLYGPYLFDRMILSEDIQRKVYKVTLNAPIEGIVNAKYKSITGEVSPIEGKVSITDIHLKVDHKLLLNSSSTPVSFFGFIYEKICNCPSELSEPFKTCFHAKLCPFPWFPSGKYFELRWMEVVKVFGWLLMMTCFCLPWVVRVLLYNNSESLEITHRNQALEKLGISFDNHHLFFSLPPNHQIYHVMYYVIGLCVISLAFLRKCNRSKFDKIILKVFNDLRKIRKTEIFRFISTQMLFPFYKCGCLGMVIAPIYWIYTILMTFIFVIGYGCPTIYLTFRFLFPESIFDPCRLKKTESEELVNNTTITDLEHLLFLNEIIKDEPEMGQMPDPGSLCREFTGLRFKSRQKEENRKISSRKKIYPIAVGICCILLMHCTLIFFSEVVGFLVKMVIFLVIGTIVNVSSAGQFVMLALTFLFYCVRSFRDFSRLYRTLNERTFSFLSSELDNAIKDITNKPTNLQCDCGLIYFKNKEDIEMYRSGDDKNKACNELKMKNGRLMLHCLSLALFVDVDDVLRIPKKYFSIVCELTSQGCPGKVLVNLVGVIKHIIQLVFFLGCVLSVVVMFHSVYTLTATQQLLLTLVGSLIPFLFNLSKDMNSSKKEEFNKYAFEGSMIEILLSKYHQEWPVCGFSFRFKEPSQEIQVQCNENQEPNQERQRFEEISISIDDNTQEVCVDDEGLKIKVYPCKKAKKGKSKAHLHFEDKRVSIEGKKRQI